MQKQVGQNSLSWTELKLILVVHKPCDSFLYILLFSVAATYMLICNCIYYTNTIWCVGYSEIYFISGYILKSVSCSTHLTIR